MGLHLQTGGSARRLQCRRRFRNLLAPLAWHYQAYPKRNQIAVRSYCDPDKSENYWVCRDLPGKGCPWVRREILWIAGPGRTPKFRCVDLVEECCTRSAYRNSK